MAFELTGRLIEKYNVVRVSDKFQKREFVVEKKEINNGTEYTDYIKFQLTQDRCGMIEPFKLNDEIKISFDLRGKRWEKEGNVNYFTNLSAFRIEKTAEPPMPPPGLPDDIPDEEPGMDDLPF